MENVLSSCHGHGFEPGIKAISIQPVGGETTLVSQTLKRRCHSNNSPSGADAAAYGGYAAATHPGQFADSSAAGQFAANSTPAQAAAAATAGQFAANLGGHFTGSDLSMFGAAAAQAAAGDYAAAYGQGSAHPPQYGYGPQYTQWPDGNGGGAGSGGNSAMASGGRNGQAGGGGGSGGGGGGYSYLGGGDDARPTRDIQPSLESLKIGGGGKKGDSNGYAGAASSAAAPPKKMSWANVASQPAKPQPTATKLKKPGVLAPPAVLPSASKPSSGTIAAAAAAAAMQQTGPPKVPQSLPAQPPSQDQGRNSKRTIKNL